jgi:hypothetical protein
MADLSGLKPEPVAKVEDRLIYIFIIARERGFHDINLFGLKMTPPC